MLLAAVEPAAAVPSAAAPQEGGGGVKNPTERPEDVRCTGCGVAIVSRKLSSAKFCSSAAAAWPAAAAALSAESCDEAEEARARAVEAGMAIMGGRTKEEEVGWCRRHSKAMEDTLSLQLRLRGWRVHVLRCRGGERLLLMVLSLVCFHVKWFSLCSLCALKGEQRESKRRQGACHTKKFRPGTNSRAALRTPMTKDSDARLRQAGWRSKIAKRRVDFRRLKTSILCRLHGQSVDLHRLDKVLGSRATVCWTERKICRRRELFYDLHLVFELLHSARSRTH